MFSAAKSQLAPASAALPALSLREETRLSIQNQLLREVEAMACFAMGAGLGVPPDILVSIETALEPRPANAAPRPKQEQLGWDKPGAAPPAPATDDSPAPGERLAAAHLALTKLVAPAMPGTLVLLHEQRLTHGFTYSFGAVPLARRMLLLGLLSLALLLGIALSSRVNAENLSRGLLASQGLNLCAIEIFLAAAALVGATLANLKRLEPFISACTYDPRYESSYWIRLVMGLISGIILSQFISTGALNNAAGNKDALNVSEPLLALLGGFSGELVHNILAHFIMVISNLFGGRAPAAKPPSP
jgi:hypothetical protein